MAPTINKNQIIEHTQGHKGAYLFFVIIGGILIISAILRAITVPPPPAETIITTSKKISPTITFGNIPSVEIPQKLAVYSSSLSKTDTLEFASSLAAKLNLEESSQVRNHWINEKTDEALYLEDKDSYIAFSRVYVDEKFTTLPADTLENIKKNIFSFVYEHNLLHNVVISSPESISVSTEGFVKTIDGQSANGYQFSLLTQIDGFPFFPDDLSEELAIVWTDLSGRILKIRFSPIELSLNKISEYNSLSLENVEKNIKGGLLTYIRTQPLIAQKDYSDTMSAITFDGAFLEYRQNTQNGYILPYLRFSGIGKDEEGREYYVEAISPAVKVQ